MKNKILKFVGLLVLSISFSSCGGKDPDSSSVSDSVTTSETSLVGESTLPPVSETTPVSTGTSVGESVDVSIPDSTSVSTGDSTSEEPTVLTETLTISPSALNLGKGDTGNLTVQVTPAELQGVVGITFQSANTAIASVDQTGKVTAVSVGSTTITATANDASGISNTIPVTVNKKYSSFETIITTGTANQEFVVVGEVVAMYEGGINQGIYIANGDYALQVYKAPVDTEVEIGDLVEVTGKYAWFASNRTTELVVDAGSIEVIDEVPTGATFVEPVNYTFDAATWDTITASTTSSDNVYTNRPITVHGEVSVVANTSQFKMIVDEKEIIVYFRNANDVGDIHEAIAALEIGDEITISGVIGSYNGIAQIIAPHSLIRAPITYGAKLIVGSDITKFDTLTDAILAAPTDGTLANVVMTKDAIGCGVEIVEGQNIIIDLGGFTYSVSSPTVGSPGTETNGFRFVKESATTIKNGTIDCAEENTVAILLQKYNDLILEDVTIDSRKGTNSYNYAVSTNAGTTTFKGDTHIIAREDDGVAFDLCYFQSYTDGLKVIIDPTFKGTITGKVEYAYYPSVQEEDWNLKAIFIKDGVEYTVNDADQIAWKTEKSYVDYNAFLEDLKLVNAATEESYSLTHQFELTAAKSGYSRITYDITNVIDQLGYSFTTHGVQSGAQTGNDAIDKETIYWIFHSNHNNADSKKAHLTVDFKEGAKIGKLETKLTYWAGTTVDNSNLEIERIKLLEFQVLVSDDGTTWNLGASLTGELSALAHGVTLDISAVFQPSRYVRIMATSIQNGNARILLDGLKYYSANPL